MDPLGRIVPETLSAEEATRVRAMCEAVPNLRLTDVDVFEIIEVVGIQAHAGTVVAINNS